MLISVYLFVLGEHWKFNKSWTVCIHHQHVETVGCDKVCFLWVELSGRVKPGGDSWNIHAVCILWAVRTGKAGTVERVFYTVHTGEAGTVERVFYTVHTGEAGTVERVF